MAISLRFASVRMKAMCDDLEPGVLIGVAYTVCMWVRKSPLK